MAVIVIRNHCLWVPIILDPVICQVKKEFISTVWHNSLTKLKFNLHQES
jgi:hypothetical protein